MPPTRRPARSATAQVAKDLTVEEPASSFPSLPPAVEIEPEALSDADHATSRPRFLPFLLGQLGWTEGYGSDSDATLETMDAKREGVYNFFQVPWNLEPLLTFGCG